MAVVAADPDIVLVIDEEAMRIARGEAARGASVEEPMPAPQLKLVSAVGGAASEPHYH